MEQFPAKVKAEDLQPEEVICSSCGATGLYFGRGAVLNGKFTGFIGKCYRCNGKGYQTPEDEKRNACYDKYRRVSP
jgi:hypothetical protein